MAGRNFEEIRKKLFPSPNQDPKETDQAQAVHENIQCHKTQLINEDLFYLPQEVLDTSRGQVLVEFMKEWEKKKPSKRPLMFDYEELRNESVEIDEERFKRFLEKQRQHQSPVQCTPTAAAAVAGTSRRSLATVATNQNVSNVENNRDGQQKSFKSPAPVPAPIPKSAVAKNISLRRSVLRTRNENNFANAVASTPCDANLHPLSSSLSPIENNPLTVLKPTEINRVQILNDFVIPSPSSTTPPGIIPSNQPAKPKNLSKFIENDVEYQAQDREDGLIARINENFDQLTSDDSNDVAEPQEAVPEAQTAPNPSRPSALSQMKSRPLTEVRQILTSSSSISSYLMENFTESLLPSNNVAVSPGDQPLLQKALKEPTNRNSRKVDTFVVPKAKPNLRDKKTESKVNEQMKSYLELSEARPNGRPNGKNNNKSKRNSKKKSTHETVEISKRRLFSQRFDESQNASLLEEAKQPVAPSVLEPPSEFADPNLIQLYERRQSSDDTQQGPSTRRSSRIRPTSVANEKQPTEQRPSTQGAPQVAETFNEEVPETEPTQKKGGRNKKSSSTKASAAVECATDTDDLTNEVQLPTVVEKTVPDRRSNAVQTSLRDFDERESTPEPPNRRRGKAQSKDRSNLRGVSNRTISKPPKKKKPLVSPSQIVESAQFEGGVRVSKRQKYVRTDGYDLIPQTEKINYAIPKLPNLRGWGKFKGGAKGHKKKKGNVTTDAEQTDADEAPAKTKRGRAKKTAKQVDSDKQHDDELPGTSQPPIRPLEQIPESDEVEQSPTRSKRVAPQTNEEVPELTSPSKRVSILKHKATKDQVSPSSLTSQQRKLCKPMRVVVEKLPNSLVPTTSDDHTSDSGLVTGTSNLSNGPTNMQLNNLESNTNTIPSDDNDVQINGNSDHIEPPQVNVTRSSRNASRLEEWTQKLLNVSACDKSEMPSVDINFELDFDQLADTDDFEFVSHENVDFASYKGEHFKNSGYMRMHPRAVKSRSRAKKFNLKFLLITGGSVDVNVDGKHFKLKGGSQVVVLKGQRYEMANLTDQMTLMFFYKT